MSLSTKEAAQLTYDTCVDCIEFEIATTKETLRYLENIIEAQRAQAVMEMDWKQAVEIINKYESAWIAKNRGKILPTPAGKYKGRSARVDSAFVDVHSGELMVLAMTLNRRGEPMNSHGDTRTYWPISYYPELTDVLKETTHD